MKRALVKEINETFEKAGKLNDWIHNEFRSLYELNQLARFQIFDLNWFPGAARIMDLVDQLHTIVTPKEDFLSIASLLHLKLHDHMSKQHIVEVVKAHRDWRTKSFEFEILKQFECSRLKLAPLYAFLAEAGFKTDQLPAQIGTNKWMLNAQDGNGNWETLYLNQSDRSDRLMIQSATGAFIGVITQAENLLCEKLWAYKFEPRNQ